MKTTLFPNFLKDEKKRIRLIIPLKNATKNSHQSATRALTQAYDCGHTSDMNQYRCLPSCHLLSSSAMASLSFILKLLGYVRTTSVISANTNMVQFLVQSTTLSMCMTRRSKAVFRHQLAKSPRSLSAKMRHEGFSSPDRSSFDNSRTLSNERPWDPSVITLLQGMNSMFEKEKRSENDVRNMK